MTLEDYVDALPSDPLNPTSETLPWREDYWPADELEALPHEARYGVVQAFDENDLEVFQRGFLSGQLIDVRLYQKPRADGTQPSKAHLSALFEMLLRAPDFVDEGKLFEKFEGLVLDGFRQKPQPDPNKPGGLFALVRFRLLVRH